MGPLRADAPAWCLAPFEPEGLLRWKSDNINRRSWVFAVNNSSIWQSFPLSVQYRQYYQGQSGYTMAMSWSISRLFLKTCFDLWVFKKCNAMWSRKFLICRLTRRDWSTGFWWAFRSSCSAFSYTSPKVLIHALMHISCHTSAAICNPWTQVLHALLRSCSHPHQQAALQLQLCLLHRRGSRNCSLSFLYTGVVHINILLPETCSISFFRELTSKEIIAFIFWRTDWCLGPEDSIPVPGVDRHECHACVCPWSTGNIGCVCEWMVLQVTR